MRVIILLFSIILLINCKVLSQISIFVDNTYQHEIQADSLSGKKTIINQKTFDLKGNKLLFETNYDFETMIEKNIVAYFYDSLDRMISKEIQTVDRTPIKLFRISYDENNDTSVVEIFVPLDDTIAISNIKRYYYDNQKRLKELKQFDINEKLLVKQVLTFKKTNPNPSSLTVNRYDSESCKQKYVFSYSGDTANLLKKVQIKDGCNPSPYKKYSIEYDYNPKNKIAAEKKTLKSGKVIRKRIYEYTQDVDLSTFYDINDKNKITAFYSRTFFWHKVSWLNVKSFFE